MNIEVLANKRVLDILRAAKHPIRHMALALLIQFGTVIFHSWYVDKLVNMERGLDHVNRH
jgi:hypothetical protein